MLVTLALALVALLLVPVAVSAVARLAVADVPWYARRTDSTGLAPDPRATPEAVVQVYAARALGWRGAFGVHSWIVVKPADAPAYKRYEVVGWGVQRGLPAIRVDRHAPDAWWFGSEPTVIAEIRGEEAGGAIRQIEAAIAEYPWPDEYRVWPGPNSNTFTAWVARRVPALRLDLPPTAVGKDYLGDAIVARTPSGTGLQLSLGGLFGVAIGAEEGLEVNLLGLTIGLDLLPPAIKLPGIGRIGA